MNSLQTLQKKMQTCEQGIQTVLRGKGVKIQDEDRRKVRALCNTSAPLGRREPRPSK